MRRALAGLLAADVISTTGTEMTAVALPWFVLVASGSATRMGAVLGAESAGIAVLGMWGGAAAGRLGARRAMLAADLVRACLVGLVPLLYALGALSFPVLLAVGFAVGSLFPAYGSAQRLVLAGLVDEDELRLTRVGGLLGAVNETASFAGPALGGALVVVIGAPTVLVLDAGSYLCAFGLVATLVGSGATAQPPPAEAAATPAGGGLRYLAGQRQLRRQVLGMGVVNLGWAAMIATLPVLALRGGGASLAGWLLASFGGGSVIGGLVAARARATGDRVGPLVVAGMAASAWLLLLPVPAAARTVAVGANGVCCGLFYPRFFAAVTTRTPAAVRAGVLTAVNIALSAPAPVGFLAAGVLAERTGGATASLLLAAVASTAGAAVAVTAMRVTAATVTAATVTAATATATTVTAAPVTAGPAAQPGPVPPPDRGPRPRHTSGPP